MFIYACRHSIGMTETELESIRMGNLRRVEEEEMKAAQEELRFKREYFAKNKK